MRWRPRRDWSSLGGRSSCCRARGAIGPSLRRLIEADDPKNAAAALRGLERADDYSIARRLAQALAWADLFVFSDLEPQVVEDLSIAALERPEQARRLVAISSSSSFVSQAELTHADVTDDDNAVTAVTDSGRSPP